MRYLDDREDIELLAFSLWQVWRQSLACPCEGANWLQIDTVEKAAWVNVAMVVLNREKELQEKLKKTKKRKPKKRCKLKKSK